MNWPFSPHYKTAIIFVSSQYVILLAANATVQQGAQQFNFYTAFWVIHAEECYYLHH